MHQQVRQTDLPPAHWPSSGLRNLLVKLTLSGNPQLELQSKGITCPQQKVQSLGQFLLKLQTP